MGALLTKITNRLFPKKELMILIYGLDGAGKTTMLYRLAFGETLQTISTVGANVEVIQLKDYNLRLFDVSGAYQHPKYFGHYFKDTKGLVFVVDSADVGRVEEARSTLHVILAHGDLKDVVLLVLANKQDVGEMDVDEVIRRMELENIQGSEWRCQGMTAVSGQGLIEGWDWMVKKLEDRIKSK